MKIDRSNYEIWLIDWLDGNLTDPQVEQLTLFLSENPEIRDEFDELPAVSLRPSDNTFPLKDRLKKSTEELSESQFEYLCVACLENDLSAGQDAELKEIIAHDTEKKRTYELMQKTRLIPVVSVYKNKKQLLKRTAIQRVIRLSVVGLSAAAAVALIINTYLIIPKNLPEKGRDGMYSVPATAHNEVDERRDEMHLVPGEDNKPVIKKQNEENLFARVQKHNKAEIKSDPLPELTDDSLHRKSGDPEIPIKRISIYPDIDLKKGIIRNTLIASDFTFIVPSGDEERSNIGRFIARNFREKILKENTSKDGPLKAYEIVGAGVTGLNRLLGWEMALEKNNDETGKLKSVYFSSKILKINVPVKKEEPLL